MIEEDEKVLDNFLSKENLLEIPLQKLIANYPINTDESNSKASSYSPIASKSATEGSLSINEDDFPDFCN